MKRRSLVVEVEDNQLRLVACVGRGRSTRIGRSETIEMTAVGRNGFRTALEGFLRGQSLAGVSVRVAVSDRRLICGQVSHETTPAKSKMGDLLLAESRRVGMFSDSEDLLVGYVADRSRSRWLASFVAAPTPIVDDLTVILARNGADRIWLTSIEAVLAAGLTSGHPGAKLVLDIGMERARLVLAENGRLLASRKMKLPGTFADHDKDGVNVFPPLAAEINRSCEFFQGLGFPRPEELVLVGELGDGDPGLVKLEEMVGLPIKRAAHAAFCVLDDGNQKGIAWAVPALLAQWTPKTPLPFLVEPESSPLNSVFLRVAVQLVGVALLVAGLLLAGVALGAPGKRSWKSLAVAVRQLRAHEDAVHLREQQLEVPQVVGDRRLLLATLDAVPSVSRLLATIGHASSAELRVTAIELDANTMRIKGVIRTEDRLLALRHLGELDRVMRTLSAWSGGGGRLSLPDPKVAGIPFEYWSGQEDR